ncbi:kinase-like protein [Thelephora ganbajun]|uniref:Kinase-like protein n=1 Tax=Thelephora ganbajun TaxID=370292 RepID=A0ACB6Z3Q1_THEGA|nr:kinase-like protein [Thelephora ganbajun]
MDSDPPRFWEILLDNVDVSVRTLGRVLSSKEGREFVYTLGPRDAGLCIELLDRGLRKSPFNRGAFLLALITLASRHKRFPCSFMITDRVDVSDRTIASGGFADVKSATYGDSTVVVRSLRVTSKEETEKIWSRFCREVIIWNSLAHKNILKLLGVLGGIHSPEFSTMTDFMAYGNIMQYIKSNHSNRLELLHGVAEGLKYIHDMDLAHGDLKGANILVTNDIPPQACLADFGFTTVILESCPSVPSPTVAEGADSRRFLQGNRRSATPQDPYIPAQSLGAHVQEDPRIVSRLDSQIFCGSLCRHAGSKTGRKDYGSKRSFTALATSLRTGVNKCHLLTLPPMAGTPSDNQSGR